MVKNPPANAEDGEDEGSIPGLGRSLGGGHGSPLQYSCLENPMDRGAWEGSNELDTKIRDTKGTFHTKMGSIKDRNCMEWRPTPVLLPGKSQWCDHSPRARHPGM